MTDETNEVEHTLQADFDADTDQRATQEFIEAAAAMPDPAITPEMIQEAIAETAEIRAPIELNDADAVLTTRMNTLTTRLRDEILTNADGNMTPGAVEAVEPEWEDEGPTQDVAGEGGILPPLFETGPLTPRTIGGGPQVRAREMDALRQADMNQRHMQAQAEQHRGQRLFGVDPARAEDRWAQIAPRMNGDYILNTTTSSAPSSVQPVQAPVTEVNFEPGTTVEEKVRIYIEDHYGVLGLLTKANEGSISDPELLCRSNLGLGDGAPKIVSIILSTPAYIDRLVTEDHATQSILRVFEILKRYSANLVRGMSDVNQTLSSYNKAVKPPVSLNQKNFQLVKENSGLSLKLYKGLMQFIKLLSSFQSGATPIPEGSTLSQDSCKLLLTRIFMSEGGQPSIGSNSSDATLVGVLETLVQLNKFSDSPRWFYELEKLNEVAKNTLFNSSYKGVFLMNPPILSDSGDSVNNWTSNAGFNCDSRHYLYRLQKQALADNPWMPKVPSYGLHIARPQGGRNGRINFKTVTIVKPPKRLKLRTREEYTSVLISRYSKLIDTVFQRKYGLRATVTRAPTGITRVDLGDRGTQAEVVGKIRSSLNITSRTKVEDSRLMAMSPMNTAGVPYFILKNNGALKEKYKGKIVLWLVVEVFSPPNAVDLRRLVDNSENITDKYYEDMLAVDVARPLRNHPLTVAGISERGVNIPGAILDDALDLSHRDNLFTSSSVNSRGRPTNVMVDAGSGGGRGNVITPTSGRSVGSGMDTSLSAPLLLVTQSLLLASKDILTIGATLSRRVVRAGLRK